MSTKAHIETDLSLKGRSIPIDDDTVELFHFDISANGVKGTKPMGTYVDDSTVLYYDMGEIFTNTRGSYIVDKSPNGRYGKINGCTLIGGRNGKALYFDGADDQIQIDQVEFTNGMSLEAWFYWQGSGLEMLFGKDDVDNYLGLQSGSHFRIQDNNNANIDWTIAPPQNEWAHIVLIRDSDIWELYLNGETLGTNPVIGTLYINTIGNGYSTDAYMYTGRVDKLVISNKVMLPIDVKSSYMEGIYAIDVNGKYGSSLSIKTAWEIGEEAMDEGRMNYTNELINPTEFTISMWVKGAGVAFSLNDPSGTFLFQAGVGSLDWNTRAMSMEIPTEDWNMMTVTFNEAGGWKLYNNGKLIAEDNNPYILTVPTGSYISVGCYGEVASNVMIDELRIDKIARTDEEIEQWYISQAPFFPLGNERIVL